MTIKKLIEAVERGEFPGDVSARDLGKPDAQIAILTFYEAFSGSLNAAKALHDALLPGWEWACGCEDGRYLGGVAKANLANSKNVSHDQPTPARAWLLAILRALEAPQEPTP